MRCIKPNTQQETYNFQDDFVMIQLKYTGEFAHPCTRKPIFLGFLIFPHFSSRYVGNNPHSSGGVRSAAKVQRVYQSVRLSSPSSNFFANFFYLLSFSFFLVLVSGLLRLEPVNPSIRLRATALLFLSAPKSRAGLWGLPHSLFYNNN